MKSLSKSLQTLCVTTSLMIPFTAKSDIFIMKDGTQIKGNITKQTYEYYTLKYEIAENVLGEKKVLIKEVVNIIKDDISMKDFQRIKKLFPTSDFWTLADYEMIKKKYFDEFYAKYPRSKNTDDVKMLQKKIDKEYETIKNGGVKIDGDLLNKGQIDANKYEVESILLLRQLENNIEKNKYITAFRIFDEMEKYYKHTRPFPKAIDAVQKILPEFIISLTELSDSVEIEAMKKKKYIDRLPSTEKKRITDLLNKEVIDYQASLLDAEEELQTKWLPLNKYEKEPIDLVLKHAQSELKRMEKFSENEYQDGGKIYRDILAAIGSKDPDAGTKHLSVFQRLNPPISYLNDLKIAVLATKDEATARQERERLALTEQAKAEAAKKQAEREVLKNKKKNDTSAGDRIKKKLNINKKEKALIEAEK